MGSSTGSAYGATRRTVMCAAMIRAASQPPYDTMSAGTFSFTPSPTAAYAPTPTTSAMISRKSSAPRRRRWTNCMRAPDCWAMSAALPGGRRLVVGQAPHRALGLVQAARADAALDRARGELVQVGDPDVRRLVGMGEVDPGNVALDAPEDRDDSVLLADVVLVLGPGPGGGADHPGDAQDAEQHQTA